MERIVVIPVSKLNNKDGNFIVQELPKGSETIVHYQSTKGGLHLLGIFKRPATERTVVKSIEMEAGYSAHQGD